MHLREELLSALHSPREPRLIQDFTQGHKRIAVILRPDGDVQVEFHIRDRSGSPFEQLFAVLSGSEESAADEISGFVTDLLEERVILAVDDRLFRGGRRWVKPGELTGIRRLSFSASWLGSFDRP